MSFARISLKGRALRLLSGREHSRLELQRKLAYKEEELGELERVLDELEAKGFIDEQRVLESVIHRRAARLGAMRIRQELQAKGLAPDAVAQTMEALQATELVRAKEVWRKRFAAEPASTPAERAKQMRFLAARGFAAEVIRRVVSAEDEDVG